MKFLFERSVRISTILLLFLFALSFLVVHLPSSFSITPNDVFSTNSAIDSAFSATYRAEALGANVSALISQLNAAILLEEKAQAENASDPSQASADLRNATQMAASVSANSVSLGEGGASAREVRNAESIGSAAGIVVIASLAYVFGGRIYRLGWFYVHRNHLVKRSSG